MSTAVEIEAAIAQLPSAEQEKLHAWWAGRTMTKPKTGAELASLWPASFHLTKQEADEFTKDLEAAHQSTPKAPAWE